MSSLTAYFGQVSAIVEFLDTYGPIVFHCKKIHWKTLMTFYFQFFLVILFHYKTFTHTLFNCKKKSIAKHWWLSVFNFSLSFYSITKHLHIHYLIVKKIHCKTLMTIFFSIFPCHFIPLQNISTNIIQLKKKNPLQNIDDYFSSIFLVILFHYKTFTHILFNCKKIHCKKLMTIFCSIFPCHFIPLQNISRNII